MEASTSSYTAVPYLDLQPDYGQVLHDVSRSVVRTEAFWCSGYLEGRPSVHGKVVCTRDEDGDLVAKGAEGVVLTRAAGNDEELVDFRISVPGLAIPPTLVRRPRLRVTPASLPSFPVRLNSFDVSPTRPLVVLGGDDGGLVVHNLEDPSEKVLVLKGCIGDITQTRFFPSGEVVLSAALSGILYVHSALRSPSPVPVRSLTSHTRPATCCAIIGRGKHILSGSKDGTVKRWDLAEASVVASASFGQGEEVLAMDLEPVGSDGCRLWVGLKSGRIQLTGVEATSLPTLGPSIEVVSGESITAVACSTSTPRLAVGTSSGVLALYDTSSATDLTPPRLLARLRRSPATITSLAWLPSGSLLVGSADGMPWICADGRGSTTVDAEGNAKGSTWGVESELGGWEESIEQVRVGSGGQPWVGGREGVGRY